MVDSFPNDDERPTIIDTLASILLATPTAYRPITHTIRVTKNYRLIGTCAIPVLDLPPP